MDKARIAKLERPANGSSQPWFCTLDDGSSWLVKFAGAGPGRQALLAEYVANSLGRLWGLPIPEAKPVLLDAAVERAGTDEFWDVLARSQGWNLAIRTIADAVDLVPDETLPRSTRARMLAFDLVLANWDRAAQSRNLLRDPAGQVWWIDHGSCRFLHQLRRQGRLGLPSTHFLFDARERVEPEALPMLDESAVHDVVAGAPASWLEAMGHDQDSLAGDLIEYLRHALSEVRRPRV